jgi:hypothetical protein
MVSQIDGGGQVEATAALPKALVSTTNDAVKIATPDLILANDEAMSIEIMTDLIFEDIGGYELATISRHDLVNGQKVIYTPIKNLTDLYLQYNPNNVLRLQASDSYFKSLSLSIFDHLPVCGTGYDLVEKPGEPDRTKWTKVPNCKSVYIDPLTGDLIINLVNVKENEQAEIQILTSGYIFDDTIHDGSN